MDALWAIFEGLRSDDVFLFEGSVEPQVEGVVCHTSECDESAANDDKVTPRTYMMAKADRTTTHQW